MVMLGISGRRGSAVRMLAAVSVVYIASEGLGVLWLRQRPFARLSDVSCLVPHDAGRSFPSRHVASGLAMASIGGREHTRLGRIGDDDAALTCVCDVDVVVADGDVRD